MLIFICLHSSELKFDKCIDLFLSQFKMAANYGSCAVLCVCQCLLYRRNLSCLKAVNLSHYCSPFLRFINHNVVYDTNPFEGQHFHHNRDLSLG